MPWPPTGHPFPTNRTNSTAQQNTHPEDHNATNAALNDVVNRVDTAVTPIGHVPGGFQTGTLTFVAGAETGFTTPLYYSIRHGLFHGWWFHLGLPQFNTSTGEIALQHGLSLPRPDGAVVHVGMAGFAVATYTTMQHLAVTYSTSTQWRLFQVSAAAANLSTRFDLAQTVHTFGQVSFPTTAADT